MSSPSLDELTRPRDFYNQRAKELRLELEEVVKRQGSYRTGVIVLGLFACVMLYQSIVVKEIAALDFCLSGPPWLISRQAVEALPTESPEPFQAS